MSWYSDLPQFYQNQIRAMGLKDGAKALMAKAGVPIVPGYHGETQDTGFLAERADYFE